MKRQLLGLAISCLVWGGAIAWGVGFGSDQRSPSPSIKPYTAAVRVLAHGGIGCGFLVGPDLLLTAAHVVSDARGEVYGDIAVECGVAGAGPVHTARVKEAYLHSPWNPDPASGEDWALVRLDRPVGLVYGWAECQSLSDRELRTLPVEFVGYSGCNDDVHPEFSNMSAPYRCPGVVRDVGSQIFFHDCAMWGGSSGGALLAWCDGNLRVVGVNTAGVDVEGEVLDHGFRKVYTKSLGNIGVPVRHFDERYRQLSQGPIPKLRQLWLRNKYRDSLRVCLRYRSALADPKQPFVISPWQEIQSQKRVCILEPKSGCIDDEVFLSFQDSSGLEVGPKASLEFEVEGAKRNFFRKYIGSSVEYTATYP